MSRIHLWLSQRTANFEYRLVTADNAPPVARHFYRHPNVGRYQTADTRPAFVDTTAQLRFRPQSFFRNPNNEDETHAHHLEGHTGRLLQSIVRIQARPKRVALMPLHEDVSGKYGRRLTA